MHKVESYEEMLYKRAQINTYFEAKNNIHIAIMQAIDRGNQKLNSMINDFRHSLNDQLIELKYGKNYKASFLDDILIQIEKL